MPKADSNTALAVVTEWVRASAQARFPGAEVNADTNIIESGLLDSVEILYLVGFLEERFGIALPIEEFIPENFATAEAVAKLVDRLSSGQGR